MAGMSSQRPAALADGPSAGQSKKMHMSRTNKGQGNPPLTDEALEKLIMKGLLLFFAAVLIYIPAMNGGYIYDDDSLLYNNPAIRRGQGWNAEAWKGLWAFWLPVGENANAAADYAPLADTTLWLEWRFWGNNGDLNGPDQNPAFRGWGSPGYHITNIILHGIAALLLWYLLAQMRIPGAWLASLVWAVHPVCAESVAWIAERRNPLSMILFILTMINWFKFQRTGKRSSYWLAVFLFLLTMFAKTSIVMLPVLLLLCTWWERGWTVKLNARETMVFAASQITGLLCLISVYALWKLMTPFEPLGFMVALTGIILTGLLFVYLYKRLAPMWKEMVDFQGFQSVFLLWCGGFVMLLMWLNGPPGSQLSANTGIPAFLILITLPAAYIMKLLRDRFGTVWRQVVPFFIISIIFGIITIYFQNSRAINEEYVPGYITNPIERIPAACFALGFYLYKILIPTSLNLIYPQWHRILPYLSSGMSHEQVLTALNNQQPLHYSFIGLSRELIIGLNFLAFFYLAWRYRATWGRHAIFGMGMFVIMIFPVLGFTRMAYMRLTLVSDHFQYAPMVGVIVLVVAGLVEVHKRLQPVMRPALVVIGAALVVAFCGLTWQRAIAFSDPDNLWRDNIKKNPESWQGHSHMGALYWSPLLKYHHDVEAALEEWRLSVKFAPYLYETHNNYALALNEKGGKDPALKQAYMEESLRQFDFAVNIDPRQVRVRMNYANALYNAGLYEQSVKNLDKAADYYQQSIQQYMLILQTDGDPGVFNLLGIVYMQTNQFDNAIWAFQQAFDIYQKITRQKSVDYEHNLQQAKLLKQRTLVGSDSGTTP